MLKLKKKKQKKKNSLGGFFYAKMHKKEINGYILLKKENIY